MSQTDVQIIFSSTTCIRNSVYVDHHRRGEGQRLCFNSFEKITDLSLAEALGGVAASGVREVGGVLWLDSDVVVEGDVLHLNIIVSPPAEELDIGVVVSAGCGLGGVKVSHALRGKREERKERKRKIFLIFFFSFVFAKREQVFPKREHFNLSFLCQQQPRGL